MAWPTKGYSEFAQLLGNNPGLAIFRRFATLNAQNLLYLQSEVAILEDELKRIVAADSISENEKRNKFQTDISELREASSGSPEGKQWAKVLEIRAKLKEYNDALLQHAQLYALPGPNTHDLGVLVEWYNDPDRGQLFMPIPEGDSWEPANIPDLVALSARRTDGDVFTRWITEKIVPWLHTRVLGHLFKANRGNGTTAMYVYEDSKFNNAANNISIVLSSAIPTASIFVLNHFTDLIPRLVIVVLFSAVFTACLAIFTNARRVEIFTAAMALASVQVVFIGTNSPANSPATNNAPPTPVPAP